MTFSSPVSDLKGVGTAQADKFAALGIKTARDLVNHFPRRYEDYSQIGLTSQLRPGKVTIEASIKQASGRYVRRGMHITEAIASDESGSVRIVWFNQPYRAAALKKGQKYLISGEYQLRRQRFSIQNPSLEQSSDLPLHTGRILAVYPETKGLTSRQIRQAVQQVLPLLDDYPETLPRWILKQHDLVGRSEAIKAIHQPASNEILDAARRRLGFEEVFELGLASLLNKLENQSESSLPVAYKPALAVKFSQSLPFKLTDGQRLAVMRAYKDLEKSQPMNRLLEGDVGSGKTVVATMIALMPLAQGWQVALMAPTELLARQHAETIHKLLASLGMEQEVLLLVGSLSAAQKKSARDSIATGKAGLIIGTQALIQEQVDMHKLALVIIDEQHRFGVDQRQILMSKAGHMPHVLSMTATPIPRSLALTLYGELDISLLKEKPAGRQPVITELVPPSSKSRLYKQLVEELKAGRQMFVVTPLISESPELAIKSAESTYQRLKTRDFKDYKVGLLHGRLKAADKQTVMKRFLKHELDILVTTTVIEVGVDVPNASIMLIESPERFGLAQLHQLRGRVGRGSHQAYCYLMLSDAQSPSRRLRALASSSDGFELAELDLELRGPGAIYGTAQHGALDLKIAKLTDANLIATARTAAQAFLDKGEDLLQYKELMKNVSRLRKVTNLN